MITETSIIIPTTNYTRFEGQNVSIHDTSLVKIALQKEKLHPAPIR